MKKATSYSAITNRERRKKKNKEKRPKWKIDIAIYI
jgi:hypothetical protein